MTVDPVGSGRAPLPPGGRAASIAMSSLVAIDLVLGVAALFAVPFHRVTAVVPARGQPVYLAHAVLGLILTLAAVVLVERSRGHDRQVRAAAITGLVGLGLAGAGGVLAVVQATRLPGMALMLLGSVGAIAGYVMPLVEDEEPRREHAATADGSG